MKKNKVVGEHVILFVMCLGSFLTPFMSSALNVAMPQIAKDLDMNAITLTWVSTSYLLAAAVFLVPFGRLSDIYGRKNLFLLGTVVFAITSAMLMFVASWVPFLVMRIFQGIGGAMMFSTAMPILVSVIPAERRGQALGINVAATYFGLSIGPFIGGVLTESLGWRAIFLVNIPLGLLIFSLIMWRLTDEPTAVRKDRFDFLGTAFYSLGLLGLMYGFTILPGVAGFVTVGFGIVFLIVFALWEMKAPSPVLDMRLFRNNRIFAFSNAAALINYMATFSVGFLLSLFLQYIKGLGPRDTGIVLISQPIFQMVLSPLAGRISDKIPPRAIASAGMFITTICLYMLVAIDGETPIWFIVVSLMFLGASFAMFSSPNTNAVMSSVDKKHYGVASGTLGTMRLTGQMLSMGIATLLFALFLGSSRIRPANFVDFISCVRVAFVIFGTLCFVGIFASLARGTGASVTQKTDASVSP